MGDEAITWTTTEQPEPVEREFRLWVAYVPDPDDVRQPFTYHHDATPADLNAAGYVRAEFAHPHTNGVLTALATRCSCTVGDLPDRVDLLVTRYDDNMEPCPACGSDPDPNCAICDGEGFVPETDRVAEERNKAWKQLAEVRAERERIRKERDSAQGRLDILSGRITDGLEGVAESGPELWEAAEEAVVGTAAVAAEAQRLRFRVRMLEKGRDEARAEVERLQGKLQATEAARDANALMVADLKGAVCNCLHAFGAEHRFSDTTTTGFVCKDAVKKVWAMLGDIRRDAASVTVERDKLRADLGRLRPVVDAAGRWVSWARARALGDTISLSECAIHLCETVETLRESSPAPASPPEPADEDAPCDDCRHQMVGVLDEPCCECDPTEDGVPLKWEPAVSEPDPEPDGLREAVERYIRAVKAHEAHMGSWEDEERTAAYHAMKAAIAQSPEPAPTATAGDVVRFLDAVIDHGLCPNGIELDGEEYSTAELFRAWLTDPACRDWSPLAALARAGDGSGVEWVKHRNRFYMSRGGLVIGEVCVTEHGSYIGFRWDGAGCTRVGEWMVEEDANGCVKRAAALAAASGGAK